MLNLVVGLQLLTIILSRGDIFVLGEAYAFGVMWSFSMKGLAVLVLRYKQPGKRDFRVPLNFTVGKTEIPVGLGLITLMLFALSIMNLFTKQVATIAGVAFTLVFFTVFEISEKITLKHGAKHQELDMFNLESGRGTDSRRALGVRPGNELVMVRNSNALYNLGAVLDRLQSAPAGRGGASPSRAWPRGFRASNEVAHEDLFSVNEQELFTRALSLAEKRGQVHSSGRRARDAKNGKASCARRKVCSPPRSRWVFPPGGQSRTRLASPAWRGKRCRNRDPI